MGDEGLWHTGHSVRPTPPLPKSSLSHLGSPPNSCLDLGTRGQPSLGGLLGSDSSCTRLMLPSLLEGREISKKRENMTGQESGSISNSTLHPVWFVSGFRHRYSSCQNTSRSQCGKRSLRRRKKELHSLGDATVPGSELRRPAVAYGETAPAEGKPSPPDFADESLRPEQLHGAGVAAWSQKNHCSCPFLPAIACVLI